MATPIVAGVAAAVMSQNPTINGATAQGIYDHLLATAVDVVTVSSNTHRRLRIWMIFVNA